MSVTVDIVVPTVNQASLTAACFASIGRTAAGAARILWVDNGSGEAERRLMRAALAESLVPSIALELPEPIGFVKATNVGLAASTAPFVLLLNNDTELPAGWLERFLGAMDRHPEVGLVGPWAVPHSSQWQANRPQLQMHGSWDGPLYLLEPERMLAFFCVLLRRQAIQEVGYLDEIWGPGYGDDDDYCARAQFLGWRLALHTEVEVLHHGGQTFATALAPETYAQIRAANVARLRQRWPQYDPDRRVP